MWEANAIDLDWRSVRETKTWPLQKWKGLQPGVTRRMRSTGDKKSREEGNQNDSIIDSMRMLGAIKACLREHAIVVRAMESIPGAVTITVDDNGDLL